jgi:hypothetical protein
MNSNLVPKASAQTIMTTSNRYCAVATSLLLSLILAGLARCLGADTGKMFASPEEAVAALKNATASADTNTLSNILGPASEDLQNPDRVQGANELKTFSEALIATNHLVRISDRRFILEIGDDMWPFPVPIVKKDGGWFFDTDAGMEELLSRRVGKNELETIPVMRAYVEAQREYASVDHDGDRVLEYAQRLVSTAEKHDGLYWPPQYEGDESPLGPLVAYAQALGYTPELREEDEAERGPYHGYYFKILARQGKHAPGGKYNYVINGHMIGGFAMVAWPAEYGQSGVMTFIVNQEGRVYQKDLGETTAKIVKKMTTYDPDPSWQVSPD